ncbi:P-loop containing nucleoside triphosphate hydrolase protein [Lasiosphaeria miniovina]|uniref:P-loop containing nucleoside triphosphate hydrolase protein n=1 Tax=Lasiosphaeria miniovina TaxID=1954250 RepID=A0AA40E391_9PEZI|nr:P-loop containing nucleoside triphosphate hydrolase protein [Lasiosphaeria miniovina]KAK0723412.1 P-loop containing nucleoside triphosphate hydrolase protein [Lasiosphaeria miniovina]
MVTFDSDAVNKLCSADQLELLDSIDRLRLQGINNYVSLPQIIVCGDQSSGKSSVLEAISGVSFPVQSNLCTRFPTELVLRRAPHIGASVSIVPHESRSDSEQVALRSFSERLPGFDSLPAVIEAAKLAMGISTHGKAFSKDILRVEITGPDRPHLTIVDLPGLIHAETKNQTLSDVELIKEVVQGYMKEQRCIILAVVSAKNDFSNQVVLQLARAADPTGDRTLGVITKPDTLTAGAASEALYVSLAKNQEVEFRLGWHVLRNTDSEKGTWSLAERDNEEVVFFQSGVWTQLPQLSLGIDKLRGRLSKVLLRQIASELPGLVEEIDGKFSACESKLMRLGAPRATGHEQRLYLFHLSQSFLTLLKAATDASYTDPFFGISKAEHEYQGHFRAVVQNLNQGFASTISVRGHYWAIEEAGGGHERMSRSNFISHIEELMKKTRGRELPGTFNPMIVAELFVEQSRPWEFIVSRHVKSVWDAACRFLHMVVDHVADGSAYRALQEEIFDPSMKDILKSMTEKTKELLNQHQNFHPITYNDHYFLDLVQKTRRERESTKEPKDILKEFFNVASLSSTNRLKEYYDLAELAEELTKNRKLDMSHHAANEALDCLDAYYKVALKRFIDDVAVQVVEGKLVSALENILSPVNVWRMSDDLVSRIAGESEESRLTREQLAKQLGVLKSGLETCKKFANLRIRGGE